MTRINGAGHHRAERHYAAMIKIRYRDANAFCPGLPATAERHGRIITVYLLPGLTAAERKSALRRLRLSGWMGCRPWLAAPLLALALFVNRIKSSIAQAGSVVRMHPAGTTGPVMLISGGAIAFLALSAVSIHILREPQDPHGFFASGPAPAASAIAVHIPGSSQYLTDGPSGSQGDVLTTIQSGSGSPPLSTSPDLPGTGVGGGSATGTGSTGGGSGTGAGGGGTAVGVGVGSTPNPTVSATVAGLPAVTVPVSPSVSAPSTSGSASVSTSASASVPASVSASAPVSVSASLPASVSVSVSLPGTASASGS